MNPRKAGPELFWKLVLKTDTCWIWQGQIDWQGYGRYSMTSNGKQRGYRAHRLAYEWSVGPIPDNLTIDHLCRNRYCVNPDHLEPVTAAENTRRCLAPNFIAHRANACRKGHEFTPENTRYRNRGGQISRICRTCDREGVARRRAQRKAAA